MSTIPISTNNSTLLADPNLCTLTTCPLSLANQSYVPTLVGNSLYAAVFGLILLVQIPLGIRYRTWGFLGGMFGGLFLEVLGYVGRIQMHFNPFTQNPFLLYLICLTIGPAFFSASVYLCLARLVVVYGEKLSRFRPRTYTITFVTCDIISLVLQAIGGGIASTANTPSTGQQGINIMIAGLSFQVASLTLFIVLCAEFAWNVYRAQGAWEPAFEPLRQTTRFKGFLWALAVATITILIRSSFRVAELSQGFHGTLANQQVTFMILEGLMIIIATTSLTVFHPGWSFGGMWSQANFKLGKAVESEKRMSGDASLSSMNENQGMKAV